MEGQAPNTGAPHAPDSEALDSGHEPEDIWDRGARDDLTTGEQGAAPSHAVAEPSNEMRAFGQWVVVLLVLCALAGIFAVNEGTPSPSSAPPPASTTLPAHSVGAPP
jgi:hypothetical protein